MLFLTIRITNSPNTVLCRRPLPVTMSVSSAHSETKRSEEKTDKTFHSSFVYTPTCRKSVQISIRLVYFLFRMGLAFQLRSTIRHYKCYRSSWQTGIEWQISVLFYIYGFRLLRDNVNTIKEIQKAPPRVKKDIGSWSKRRGSY